MALTDNKVTREHCRLPKRSTILTNVLAVVLRPIESCLGTDFTTTKITNESNIAACKLLSSLREENKLSLNSSKLSESLSEVKLVGWISPYVLLLHGAQEDLQNLRDAWKCRSLRNPAGFYIKDFGDLQDVVLESITPAQFMSLTTALHDLISDLNNCGHCPSQGMLTFYLKQLFADMKVPDKDTMHRCLGMLIQDRKAYHNGRGYVALHDDVDVEELKSPLPIQKRIRDGEARFARVRNFSRDDLSVLGNGKYEASFSPGRNRVLNQERHRDWSEQTCFTSDTSNKAVTYSPVEPYPYQIRSDSNHTQRNSFLSYSDDERLKFNDNRSTSKMRSIHSTPSASKKSDYKRTNEHSHSKATCLFSCVSSRPLTESRTDFSPTSRADLNQSVDEYSTVASTNIEAASNPGSDISTSLFQDERFRTSCPDSHSVSSKERKKRKAKSHKTNTVPAPSSYYQTELTPDSVVKELELLARGYGVTPGTNSYVEKQRKKRSKKEREALEIANVRDARVTNMKDGGSPQINPSSFEPLEASPFGKDTKDVDVKDKLKKHRSKSRKHHRSDKSGEYEELRQCGRGNQVDFEESAPNRNNNHQFDRGSKAYASLNGIASEVPLVFDVGVRGGQPVLENAKSETITSKKVLNQTQQAEDVEEVDQKKEKTKRKKVHRSRSYTEPSRSKKNSTETHTDNVFQENASPPKQSDAGKEARSVKELKKELEMSGLRVKGRREMREVSSHPGIKNPELDGSAKRRVRHQELPVKKDPVQALSSTGNTLSYADETPTDKAISPSDKPKRPQSSPQIRNQTTKMQTKRSDHAPNGAVSIENNNKKTGEDTDLEDLRAFVVLGSNYPNPLCRHISNESFHWDLQDEPECDQQSENWTLQSDADSRQGISFDKVNLKRWENVEAELSFMEELDGESEKTLKTGRECNLNLSLLGQQTGLAKDLKSVGYSSKSNKDFKKLAQQKDITSGSVVKSSSTPDQIGSVQLRENNRRARQSAMFEEKRLSLKVMGVV